MTPAALKDLKHSATRAELAAVGRQFYARGWSVGTSSNYSVVVEQQPLRLLITASGLDKGDLGEDDFVLVDVAGKAVGPATGRPSAETLLHCVLAEELGAGAVLHTHSVWATLLSDWHGDAGGFEIRGYEMLKGLAGVPTHEHAEWVAVLENTQDMPTLAAELREQLREESSRYAHGFLLRNHGLYTWGRDLAEARRHIEIFEFLFEVLGRRRSLTASASGTHAPHFAAAQSAAANSS